MTVHLLITTFQLQLLPSCCICLVHLMLDMTHSFSFFDTKFFSFLVPSPFIDLTFTQTCFVAYCLKGLFWPVRIFVEILVEILQLVSRLSLTFADNSLKSPCFLIKIVATALLSYNRSLLKFLSRDRILFWFYCFHQLLRFLLLWIRQRFVLFFNFLFTLGLFTINVMR